MAKKDKQHFGRIAVDRDRLRSVIYAQRSRLGLSHRTLAEKAGVAPTTVYNLEQGSYRIQLDKFLAVLGALDLVPENVLEIDGSAEQVPVSQVEQDMREILKTNDLDEALIRLGELIRKIR